MRQVQMPVRLMRRVSSPGTKHNYQVFEQQPDGTWQPCSKVRPHSTTAFADLGRIVQQGTKEALETLGEKVAG